MARSARKIESLLEDEPSLGDALATVYERSQGGDREVQWADVSDDISSGQWGRLIEQGILVDGDEGFDLADAGAVADALEGRGRKVDRGTEDESGSVEEPDDTSWTSWDKLAAVASVSLMFGYWMRDIRNLIGGSIDLLLGPLAQVLPFYAVILSLAVLTGVITTVFQANMMDTEKIAYYQEQMQEIQERREAAKERGDEEALEEIQQEQMEAMGDYAGMFKLQFRPMVWTMLVTIPAFLWMYWKIGARGGTSHGTFGTVVMPLVGEVTTWTEGLLGPLQAWIVWYFLCSMAFTQIIRKALDIDMTPTGS